jgi:hypothetical protein
MRKELAEMERHAVPAIVMAVVCYFAACFFFNQFVHTFAVATPRTQNYSHLNPTLLVLLIAQGLFSVGSRRPWLVLPFVWLYYATGVSTWSGSAIDFRVVEQIVHVKSILTAILPVINAVACHIYLSRQKN